MVKLLHEMEWTDLAVGDRVKEAHGHRGHIVSMNFPSLTIEWNDNGYRGWSFVDYRYSRIEYHGRPFIATLK